MTHEHSHRHIEHSGAALVDSAQRVFETAGESWTAMRAAVFAVLAQADRPMSAYDIAEVVSQDKVRRTAPNSIYRILDLFVTHNLVRRIESANGFVVNNHPSCVHDCIYLICDSCHATIHIDDDSISTGIRTIAEQHGFAAPRPMVEVRGYCGSCGQRG